MAIETDTVIGWSIESIDHSIAPYLMYPLVN